ncbi:MAG: hypothetical protein FWC36_02460 [Spirochaetes bacterium]|nr:hypothetical protein [Spirochaetota bacterium]
MQNFSEKPLPQARQEMPVIKRIRGYRLYANNGEKYLDFFQESGKAILGSRPRGFSLALKNEIEKSNFYNFPSGYIKKIEKGIAKLAESGANPATPAANQIRIAYFKTEEDLCKYVSAREGREYSLCKTPAPSLPEENLCSQSSVRREIPEIFNYIYSWFPFCGSPLKQYLNDFTYVSPVLPFPGDAAPIILLSSSACKYGGLENNYFPSPVVLAGLNNIIYNLIKFLEEEPYALWSEYAPKLEKLWSVKGPYLIPVYNEENHDMIFKTFLKKKILIQPCFDQISALPAEISEGEQKLFLDTAYNIIRSLG